MTGEAVLVTGASRGIGRAVAVRLAADGVPLVLWARDRTGLTDLATGHRGAGPVTVQAVDVRDETSVRAAVEELAEADIALRGVVLNAGVGQWHPLQGYPIALWDDIVATNLRGAQLTLVATLPLLLQTRSPQLIGVGSDSGLAGFPERAAYCASKWGLRGLLEVARAEHRQDGLRCTHLAVGAVDTGFRTGRPGSRPGSLPPENVAEIITWLLGSPAQTEIRELHVSSTAVPFGTPGPHLVSAADNPRKESAGEH